MELTCAACRSAPSGRRAQSVQVQLEVQIGTRKKIPGNANGSVDLYFLISIQTL